MAEFLLAKEEKAATVREAEIDLQAMERIGPARGGAVQA
jgi:hypothetical protein